MMVSDMCIVKLVIFSWTKSTNINAQSDSSPQGRRRKIKSDKLIHNARREKDKTVTGKEKDGGGQS